MKNKLKKKFLVWNITARCNQACEYCFGPRRGEEKDISTKNAKEKIENFSRRGIKKLIFTGGEPLLRRDVYELMKYAKDRGICVILHTNGLLLTKKFIDKANNFLDQINLPLDGFNEASNDSLRTPGHYRKIMLILQMLKNIDIKIIISTVVTRANKNCVAKIGRVLPEWIYKWRLFQFQSRGKAKDVKEKFCIDDSEFNEIAKDIKCGKYPFLVQTVGCGDREFDGSFKIV